MPGFLTLEVVLFRISQTSPDFSLVLEVGSALRLCLAGPSPRSELMLARADWPAFMREAGVGWGGEDRWLFGVWGFGCLELRCVVLFRIL